MFRKFFVIILSFVFTGGDAVAQKVPQGSGLGSFIPLIIIFAIFYFLIIRPQSKKISDHRQMVEALHRGDKIITAGGIEGSITKIDDSSNMLEVEIAQGVKVKVVRSTISDVLSSKGKKEIKKVKKKA